MQKISLRNNVRYRPKTNVFRNNQKQQEQEVQEEWLSSTRQSSQFKQYLSISKHVLNFLEWELLEEPPAIMNNSFQNSIEPCSKRKLGLSY